MNRLYDIARRDMLTGGFDWPGGQWRAWLVDASYEFSPAHENVSELPVLFPSVHVLTGVAVSPTGVALCDPVVFGLVHAPPGTLVGSIVLGSDTTGRLVWFGDDGYGFPFAPDGREVVVAPDSTRGGFFRP